MHGMDKRHDGHAWTKTVTSNIKSDMSLTKPHIYMYRPPPL
jgi:hypothetical protein